VFGRRGRAAPHIRRGSLSWAGRARARRLQPRSTDMKRRFWKFAKAIDNKFFDGAFGHKIPEDEEDEDASPQQQQPVLAENRRPATSHDLASSQPLVEAAPGLDGGLQSLTWEWQSLRRDEDGDEAHDFIVVDDVPLQRDAPTGELMELEEGVDSAT